MYATMADILDALDLDALLRLVDDERQGPAASGDLRAKQKSRVEKAIRDATAEADSYVGQRYKLPLAAVPHALGKKVVDIAVYNLFSRRGLQGGTPDEIVMERYGNAVRWLKDVAVGRASLPLPDGDGGSEGTARPAGSAKIGANRRVFSRRKLGEF